VWRGPVPFYPSHTREDRGVRFIYLFISQSVDQGLQRQALPSYLLGSTSSEYGEYKAPEPRRQVLSSTEIRVEGSDLGADVTKRW